MIKCICINDKEKPNEIPSDKWIKEEEEYHITYIYYHVPQKIQGCTLYEKPLDESCAPYESFKLSRFAISIDDLQELIELIKMCTELGEVNIEEFLKETQLEVIN